MKAHATRRAIWFLNVALLAALVGVGAWWFLDIREAVAKVPAPGADRKAPAEYLEMVKGFNKDLEGARTDVLSAPVKQKTLNEVILREDYRKKEPTHFIFTGPLPPAHDKVDKPVGDDRPKQPTGLDAIGKIDWLIWNGADRTMVVFLFKSSKTGYFNVGEFVKEKKEQPDRFKLVKATEPEPGLFKIAYEVFDEGKAEAIDQGEIQWDNRKTQPTKGSSVIYVDPKSLATPEAAADGVVGAGGDAETPPGEPVASAAEPELVQPVTVKPSEELTFEDLEPEVKQINARLVDVKFDDNTRRYFSRKGAKEMAETVKTQVAKDKLGNTIGLRLMDPGEMPADVLQLRRGDIIVAVNGEAVKDRADIVRIAEGMDENTSRVTIVVDRNGRKITYNIDPRDPKTRRAAGAYADREFE